MSHTRLFFDTNKGLLRAANVMFILSLFLLGYGLYNINPDGVYYNIDAGRSITHSFYQQGSENMEIAATVVSVGGQEFDIEHDYADAILEIKLYFEGELVYEGVSAVYSADYYNDAGEYRLSIVNVSDDGVEVVIGHGTKNTLAILSIVGFVILISVSALIPGISLILLMTVGSVLLVQYIIRKIDEQQNTSKRFMSTN